MSKGFFIDLTKCTACRGCQVACKQWHKLPAEKTKNWGSHQNPADLSYITYKLVRMDEVVVDGKLEWLFWPEQCRHCINPPCMLQADYGDSIYQDEMTGAVCFTEKTRREDIENVGFACPYNIPRLDKESGIMSKCDMCNDRVHNGLLPACVQSCPTGTMHFGELDDMLELAEETLKKVKKQYPNAVLGDKDEVRVIFLYPFDPKLYNEYAVADAGPSIMNRKQMFAQAAKPFKRIIG